MEPEGWYRVHKSPPFFFILSQMNLDQHSYFIPLIKIYNTRYYVQAIRKLFYPKRKCYCKKIISRFHMPNFLLICYTDIPIRLHKQIK
jgi:hypothetical protein